MSENKSLTPEMTFVFVTWQSHDIKEDVKKYEKTMEKILFSIENKERYNVFFIHKHEQDAKSIINAINEDLVILFLREVPRDKMMEFYHENLQDKSCKIFFEGECHSRKIHDYNHDIKYFVTIEKPHLHPSS